MTICTSCSSRSLSASSGLMSSGRTVTVWRARTPVVRRSFGEDLFLHVEHVIVELVRSAGPYGAVAVDEQLLEVPLAGGHLRNTHLPRAIGIRLKAGEGPSTREDRPGAGGGLVGDAELLRAAVLRGERERCRQHVGPARHDDARRLLQAGTAFLLANQIACPLQRGHRAISLRGIRLSEPPGPIVVTVRRYIDSYGIRLCREPDDDRQQER